MRTRIGVLIALLGAVFFLFGCSPLTTITSDDNGQLVALSTGDILIVRLEGNPSTGYEWAIRDTLRPQVLRPLGDPKLECDEIGPPGAPCTVEFQFRAASAGTTPLDLVYKRSWEDEPIDTFSVIVSVQ